MTPIRKTAYEFREEMEAQGVFFCFSGALSQNLLKDIIRNIHCRKELAGASKTQIKRIISIVIELLQNVIFYSAEPPPYYDREGSRDVGDGILMIGQDDDAFFISCGNPVDQGKVGRLRSRIERLYGMDREEILKFYRRQLSELKDEESLGAGLGFIEVAKKSSRPPEFAFDPVDEKVSYFSIKTYV